MEERTLTVKRAEEQTGDAVTRIMTYKNLKDGVFWDVTPCGFYKNRSFGET
jgi:hypothetical protein